MTRSFSHCLLLTSLIVCFGAVAASAQSFRVQCPASTITHPVAANNNSEPAYTGGTTYAACTPGNLIPGGNAFCPPSGLYPASNVNGAVKCQQISGGDGYSTMGDGTQTYMFSFGPLSGIADIAKGLPGTQFPAVFNSSYSGATPVAPGDPAATDDPSGNFNANCPTAANPATCYQNVLGASPGFSYNGAIGLAGDQEVEVPIPGTGGATAVATVAGGIVTAVTITNGGIGYTGPPLVTFSPPSTPGGITALGTATVSGGQVIDIDVTFTGSGYATAPTITIGPASNACAGPNPSSQCLTGHVDPRQIMDVGVMNGNIPAPLMAIDEDDEFFLTLTNVGMIMRPDLFEQHTVHFHGYPNASSFYDGVPDASVAINIGASFTYYYLAPDAGTYFWHCHITPPEHLQMGMVGQIYVRPRQNRVPATMTLYAALQQQETDLRTKCDSNTDILCSNPLPSGGDNHTPGGFVSGTATKKFAYNDGDGSTAYDVEYPIQIHGFDPNFHFVGMTFNPEGFADMKDKYFLLNGRSYPDTVTPGPLETQSADTVNHFSQPLHSIITLKAGQKALLRISDLDVSEYQTLASLGIPMKVIGYNAKLLRDQSGNNLYYTTNSITLGGGESLDVILDSTGVPPGTYFLYTPNLDHLSNDAENFGGLMTEIHVTN